MIGLMGIGPWAAAERNSFSDHESQSASAVAMSSRAKPTGEPESLVLHLGRQAFMLLNRFPYNSGHLMVVPNEHVDTLEALQPDVRAEMMELSLEVSCSRVAGASGAASAISGRAIRGRDRWA